MKPCGGLGQDHRRLIGAARFSSDVADERERPTPRASYLARHPIQCVVQSPRGSGGGLCAGPSCDPRRSTPVIGVRAAGASQRQAALALDQRPGQTSVTQTRPEITAPGAAHVGAVAHLLGRAYEEWREPRRQKHEGGRPRSRSATHAFAARASVPSPGGPVGHRQGEPFERWLSRDVAVVTWRARCRLRRGWAGVARLARVVALGCRRGGAPLDGSEPSGG